MNNYQSAYTGAQIDAGIGKANTAVQYAAQSLSTAQKQQARANIGAMEYPDGGNTGQLLTKTANGAAWADAATKSSYTAVVNAENVNGGDLTVYKCGAFAFFTFIGYTTKEAVTSAELHIYTLPAAVRPASVFKIPFPVLSVSGYSWQLSINMDGRITMRSLMGSIPAGTAVSGAFIYPLV